MFLDIVFIGLIGIFMWLAYMRLEWAVYAFFALLPLYQVRFSLGIPFTLLEVLLLVIVCVYALRNTWTFWEYRLFRLYKYPILGICLAGALSVGIAPDTSAALGLYKAYIIEPLLLFIVLGQVITTAGQWYRILTALVLSALAGGVWAGLQWYTGLFIPAAWKINDTFRATGFYPYPNAMALFITPVISAVAGYFLLVHETKHYFKWIVLILLLLLLVILVSTQSVGGVIAVGVGIIASLFFALQKNTYQLVLLLILVLIFGFALQVPSIKQEILLQGPSGETRQMIWNVSTEIVLENPLFGVGLHGFEPAFNEKRPQGYREAVLYPHTFIFNFWLELGLLGLASILYALGVFTRLAYARYAQDPILLVVSAGLISMLVFGLVDVPFFKNDLAILWWLFLWVPVSGVAKDPVL